MEREIRRDIQLQDQNCDFSGYVSPCSILSKFLEVAGYAADQVGFGVEDMAATGRMWVVSRFSAEWLAPIHKAQPYTVETWISRNERCMSVRHLEIMDRQGQCVARCTTMWAALDMHTHRPVDIAGEPLFKKAQSDRPVYLEAARVNAVDGEPVGTHKICYSDIDFNRHANSIRYIEWVLDTYSKEHHHDNVLKRIDINYLQESQWGDEVQILGKHTDNGDCFDLQIDNKSVCKTRLQWTARGK